MDDVTKELEAITRTATANNQLTGITGVLFYENNHFFQVIEGEEAHLRGLYSAIERDSRHQDLTMLVDRPMGGRQFSDWSLDTFYVDDPSMINPQTLGLLQSLYFENFGAEATDLVAFTRRMIDEMDSFRILQDGPTSRTN